MKTHKIAATLAIALALAGCNQPKALTNQDRAAISLLVIDDVRVVE